MDLAFAAAADRPTAVLTGPTVLAGSRPGLRCPGRTTTTPHRCGQNHHAATSSWLRRMLSQPALSCRHPGRSPGARGHADRTVPGVRYQPVPRLRAEGPQQRRLADRGQRAGRRDSGQRPGGRDTGIWKCHRRPRLRPESHRLWHLHLSTDQRGPRGHRHRSHIPIWTRRTGKPRLLPGALSQLHRPPSSSGSGEPSASASWPPATWLRVTAGGGPPGLLWIPGGLPHHAIAATRGPHSLRSQDFRIVTYDRS